MKQLLLIRHAKATHESGYTDFERPLKYSGLQDAGVMAGRLSENGIKPQLLVTSPALRTMATANIFAEHLSLPQPETDKRIYEAAEETLADVINELPNNHDCIGLVGHNPGISWLVYYLTGQMCEMAPGAVILIQFETDSWAEATKNSGSISFAASPGEKN